MEKFSDRIDLEAIRAGKIEAVRYENEVFGILPIENMAGKEVDIFMPVAIIMSIDRFWVPEYLFVK